MKVKKIMTKKVGFCHLDDKLIKAVGIMWQFDCGAVPILDVKNKVVGFITDRDICIAVTTRNRLSSELMINEVVTGKVITCSPKNDIEDVLKIMGKNQIKRLPVIKKSGALAGIISITDILRSTKSKLLRKRILKTYELIGKPSPILLKEV